MYISTKIGQNWEFFSMYWNFLLLKLLAMCILCTISFEAWGSVPCTSDNSQICKYIFFLHHVEGTGIITSKLHQNTTFQHPAKLLNPSRHSIWILHTTTRHSEFYSTHIFFGSTVAEPCTQFCMNFRTFVYLLGTRYALYLLQFAPKQTPES